MWLPSDSVGLTIVLLMANLLFTHVKHLTIAWRSPWRRPRQTGATVAGSRPLYRSIIYERQTCLVARCRALARVVRCRAGRGSARAIRAVGVAVVGRSRARCIAARLVARARLRAVGRLA